jgi:hypothetical protein
MHRFVWDLHYALPKGVRSSFWGPAGPLAVPGNYTVKLTANGKSSTQPLTIKLDPRVKTPQDALERQFSLASKLAARLGEVSVAVQQVDDLRKQLDARMKEANGNTELLAALRGVAAALTGLLIIADSSDLGSAADAATTSIGWEEAAQEALARWAAFQKEDLASVDTLLRKANLKPLIVEESPAPH